MFRRLFSLLLVLLSFHLAKAEKEPVPIQRLQGEFKFDGIPDEAFWAQITPLDFLQQIPSFGESPTEKSDVRIAHDDQFLYVGAKLSYSPPTKIAATTYKRDALVGNTDWFGIIIDSYNDKENALVFYTNPNGLRFDATVFNDALGALPINISWNAFWDVKVKTTETEWMVEMRIPFTSLNFQADDGQVKMGLICNRWIANKNETNMSPVIPPNWGDFSSWKPSMAQEVTFEGIKRKRPVYLAPYILGGNTALHELNSDGTAYAKSNKRRFEPGLDIKYGLTDNLTLDLSINTDFAQVEADDQQVNLTRFNLFFPEKRLFFQERSGIFNFNFGRTDNLFYSRRIGIKDGEPQRILGGARLVGRAGSWDFGFINMQTAKSDETNSENFGVLRLRRNVMNPNSFVGLLLTNKVDKEGNYSSIYGFDSNLKFGKETFLSLRWTQSFQNGTPNKVASLDPTKFWVSLATRNNVGFNYGVSISRAGQYFDPSLGFQVRDNYVRQGHRIGYGFSTPSSSKILYHGPISRGVAFWTNEYQAFDSYNGSIGYQVIMKNSSLLNVRLGINNEQLFEVFDIPLSDDIFVPVGKYNYFQFQSTFLTTPSLPFSILGELRMGQYYDGNITSINLTPTYNISSNLELGGTYILSQVKFPERDQNITAHIARLKLLLMFNTKLSIASFIQYNSADQRFVSNVRLRYNPKEGNDLFLVYNEDLNGDRMRESPFLPLSNVQTFVLKYTYTFRL